MLPLFCSCLPSWLSRASFDVFFSAFALVGATADDDGCVVGDAFVVLADAAVAEPSVFESETVLLASLGAESALCAPSEMVVGNCWCFDIVVDAFALHCKIWRGE